jgi:DsbC/DsbD-like thiol-disulfide interchange protein
MKQLIFSGWLWVVSALVLAPPAALAQGQRKLGEAASLQAVEIKGDPIPGGKVTAVIKVQLEKGFHTHSNKPSEPQFIATVLTVDPAPGVRVGAVGYPNGKSVKVTGLDKPLSVYEEHFELSVPLGLTAAAKFPLSIPATLRYQACQGAQCYAPQKLKIEIKLESKP